MSYWLFMVPSLRLSVGGQLGWSTTVWGFQSGKAIDDCEYLQVRDSNKCPRGTYPTRTHTFDIWLPDRKGTGGGAQ
jgi:hypothetical protein